MKVFVWDATYQSDFIEGTWSPKKCTMQNLAVLNYSVGGEQVPETCWKRVDRTIEKAIVVTYT